MPKLQQQQASGHARLVRHDLIQQLSVTAFAHAGRLDEGG